MRFVKKRDGRRVKFSTENVELAIRSAFEATFPDLDEEQKSALGPVISKLADAVHERVTELEQAGAIPVEKIQDVTEEVLMRNGHTDVARTYIQYRHIRTIARESKSDLMRVMGDILFASSETVNLKRENGNIDGDVSMAKMLRAGSETSKEYCLSILLPSEAAEAHREGDIHIHDLDFYGIGTLTCCQIPLDKLFEKTFSTGLGSIRRPSSIRAAAALTAVIIQGNQNEQHGGQSIPMLDYYLAPFVALSFANNIAQVMQIRFGLCSDVVDHVRSICRDFANEHRTGVFVDADDSDLSVWKTVCSELTEYLDNDAVEKDWGLILHLAHELTVTETYQAMEALVHNLNSLHSRAGSQVPFSSVNLGTDISPEGRCVIEQFLLATEAGLGGGELPFFPVSVFKVKDGVNYNPGDPNYDLFKLAMRVSSKRMFPNYVFLDAPFNLQYYREGVPESEVVAMGCRTRVIANAFESDTEGQTPVGRGNLSFTSVNLPRLALRAEGDLEKFFILLDEKLMLVKRQMLHRLELQGSCRVYNFPFLMGQHIWRGSEKLTQSDDYLEEVICQGSLSIGFIGLAETLVALIGKHHGESAEAQELGLRIVSHMRGVLDSWVREDYRLPLSGKTVHLNWSLLATPAEGLAGRFVRMDRARFGEIPGVTDKGYYTNSSHIPPNFNISFVDKIRLEAPYHELENAGHIAYVEFDGDASKNLEAFESILRCMHDNGVGYGAINLTLDHDPVCGYDGYIDRICPKCGRDVTKPVSQTEINEIAARFGIPFPYHLRVESASLVD